MMVSVSRPEDFFAERLFHTVPALPPEKGRLLVAAHDMGPGIFERSVVFLVEHSSHGTVGVILNRRSDIPLAQVLTEWAPVVSKPPVVFTGGPVHPEEAMALGVVSAGVDPLEVMGLYPVVGGICIVNMDSPTPELTAALAGVRIYGGSAGWIPGQLAQEIARGDWLVLPAQDSDVLAPPTDDLWGEVMRRGPGPLPVFSTFPIDPTTN